MRSVAHTCCINGHEARRASLRRGSAPLLQANRVMGISLLHTGDIVESRRHFYSAMALYDPAEHRPLAMRFGVDARVSILSYRSWTLWLLGYPEAGLADIDHALRDAREFGQAATLMFALGNTTFSHLFCGDYAGASAKSDEIVALADQKPPCSGRRAECARDTSDAEARLPKSLTAPHARPGLLRGSRTAKAVAQSNVELGLRWASTKFGNILNYSRRFRAILPTISWKRVRGDEVQRLKWPGMARFSDSLEGASGDRTGWLGREDSNLRMAQSKTE
jgi:hypothetical protein